MGINLQLLGITAIPRLANKYNVKVDFPKYHELFSMPPQEFQKVIEKSEKALKMLFRKFKISWRDVYYSSDIGIERSALAQAMQLRRDDRVLDVGCGRGYFTIAAADFSKRVVGLDLMDGYGRFGWWKNLMVSMREMKLSARVIGVKSDAQFMPFRDSSFNVVASVHSIRNFQSKTSIEVAISEMKRVVIKSGRVIVAESLPVARNKAQEAHLQMFSCKAKYTWGELEYLSEKELMEIFHKVGFRHVEIEEFNHNLSVAPPLFCIDSHLPSFAEDEKVKVKRAYDGAVEMIRRYGEASPPTALVTATR